MGELLQPNVIDEQAELKRKIKEKADYKRDLIVAIQERNLQRLVEAIQRLRYYLMKFGSIKDPQKREIANTHHIRDGYWQNQLQKFLDALKQEEGKPQKSYVLSEEIYFDGVSRFMLKVSPDGNISIFPSQVSNADVKSGWNLIENAHELYYQEGENSE